MAQVRLVLRTRHAVHAVQPCTLSSRSSSPGKTVRSTLTSFGTDSSHNLFTAMQKDESSVAHLHTHNELSSKTSVNSTRTEHAEYSSDSQPQKSKTTEERMDLMMLEVCTDSFVRIAVINRVCSDDDPLFSLF